MRATTPPTHAVTLEEAVNCFEICSNDFAQNLICLATGKKLRLCLLKFPEESDLEQFEWVHLRDIHHGSTCFAISFAPETSLVVVPKIVTFCVASGDFYIRIFRTDLQNSDAVQTLVGHRNYVNDVAWDTEGEFLASVSDDHTCKIWTNESHYETTTTFCLSSPGMSVKWHAEEPHKVLVAEKRGVIHLYNVQSQQAIISVESPKSPLMSADWSLSNHQYVTALAGGAIYLWDLHRPCKPIDIKKVHEDGGRKVRFSPNNENVISSVGRPDITLKVFTSKSLIPLVEAPLKLFGGMSWHQRLPYVAAAYDRKLCFWKVQIK